MSWIDPPSRATHGPARWIVAAIVFLLLGFIAFVVHHYATHRAPMPRETALPVEQSVLISSGTIGAGGSLSDSMRRAGVAPQLAAQIERTLRPVFNPRRARPEHVYEIIRSSEGRFEGLLLWPNAFEYYRVEDASGTLRATHTEVPLREQFVGATGTVQVSLWDAMIRQGVPGETIYKFADIFGSRIDFLTEPRQGDTYKLVWVKRHANQAERDDEIIAAIYNSREKGEISAFFYKDDYFDTEGVSLQGEFLRAPLAYRRISSRFTERRYHPVLRYYRPHHGIDYSAARGTPVVSIGDGHVISAGWDGGLGKGVRIRHAGGYVSIYGHLMGFARGIHAGAGVKQGQTVGFVGSTGLATGPHLHFAFQQRGRMVNFLGLKFRSIRRTLGRQDRAAFDQAKEDGALLLSRLTNPGGPVQDLTSATTR
jgi:murein DD-endopeptidase MepM/ murein hydrolase activator NlpD